MARKSKEGARREVEMVSLTSSDGQVIVGWLLDKSKLQSVLIYWRICCKSQMHSLFLLFVGKSCVFVCCFSYLPSVVLWHLGGRRRDTQMVRNGGFWNTKVPSLLHPMNLCPATSNSIMTVRTYHRVRMWNGKVVTVLFIRWALFWSNCCRSRCWVVDLGFIQKGNSNVLNRSLLCWTPSLLWSNSQVDLFSAICSGKFRQWGIGSIDWFG